MAKYSMYTRDGRARRKMNHSQFNPSTLQPHSKKFIEERNNKKKGK